MSGSPKASTKPRRASSNDRLSASGTSASAARLAARVASVASFIVRSCSIYDGVEVGGFDFVGAFELQKDSVVAWSGEAVGHRKLGREWGGARAHIHARVHAAHVHARVAHVHGWAAHVHALHRCGCAV